MKYEVSNMSASGTRIRFPEVLMLFFCLLNHSLKISSKCSSNERITTGMEGLLQYRIVAAK